MTQWRFFVIVVRRTTAVRYTEVTRRVPDVRCLKNASVIERRRSAIRISDRVHVEDDHYVSTVFCPRKMTDSGKTHVHTIRTDAAIVVNRIGAVVGEYNFFFIIHIVIIIIIIITTLLLLLYCDHGPLYNKT